MQSQTCSFLNECIHNSSLSIVSCPVKSCSTLHDQTASDDKASSVTIHLISWSPSIQPLLKPSCISALYSLHKVKKKLIWTVPLCSKNSQYNANNYKNGHITHTSMMFSWRTGSFALGSRWFGSSNSSISSESSFSRWSGVQLLSFLHKLYTVTQRCTSVNNAIY